MNFKNKLSDLTYKARIGIQYVQEKVLCGEVFNPLQSIYRSNPYPSHHLFLEKYPIHRSHLIGGWVVSRYQDVMDILTATEYGSDQRKLARWPEMEKQMHDAGVESPYETGLAILLGEDPPDHTRTRRHAAKAFTPQALNKMRPQIEEMLKIALSRTPKAGKFEFVSTFSSPFPIAVIASILGVPPKDWDQFHRWSVAIIKILSAGESHEHHLADKARKELSQYLIALADERRRSPTEDVISTLVSAQREDPELTDRELIAIAIQLLVAGNETTTKLITNAVLALIRNPEQLELITSKPELMPTAVEEFLRYDSPLPFASRVVLEDHEFRGHKFSKGQMIVLVLAAANRDPRKFDDPDVLNLARENNRHLAFSHGAHFCLGARLARIEGALALESLIGLIPRLRLVEDGINWGTSTILFGPEKLWLEYK